MNFLVLCVKVVAMRLPPAVVTVHLKAILEGILLWSGDTKNQFKLKVTSAAEHLDILSTACVAILLSSGTDMSCVCVCHLTTLAKMQG